MHLSPNQQKHMEDLPCSQFFWAGAALRGRSWRLSVRSTHFPGKRKLSYVLTQDSSRFQSQSYCCQRGARKSRPHHKLLPQYRQPSRRSNSVMCLYTATGLPRWMDLSTPRFSPRYHLSYGLRLKHPPYRLATHLLVETTWPVSLLTSPIPNHGATCRRKVSSVSGWSGYWSHAIFPSIELELFHCTVLRRAH
jgi:hypothetical protein